ncbi:hemopexin repeat-containing protein [Streptomyces sp. NPDC058439]|uniref:hemopexin repeat-containing protein n=1 Tax=Streptomyces sp. NPDC058439 TaxID=3346500 RepID=UPI00364ED36A
MPDSFTRRIDAAAPHATDRNKVYLFKDDQYVRYDLEADRADSGCPKNIRGNWPFFDCDQSCPPRAVSAPPLRSGRGGAARRLCPFSTRPRRRAVGHVLLFRARITSEPAGRASEQGVPLTSGEPGDNRPDGIRLLLCLFGLTLARPSTTSRRQACRLGRRSPAGSTTARRS